MIDTAKGFPGLDHQPDGLADAATSSTQKKNPNTSKEIRILNGMVDTVGLEPTTSRV